jgi:hypothetical protein
MGYRGLGPLALVLFALATAGCTFCFSGCRAQDSQRELALSDFDFLELGMSFEDITEELGLPDRFTGSGLVDAQYDLDDGRIIELTFMESDKLLGARIRENDGTWADLDLSMERN